MAMDWRTRVQFSVCARIFLFAFRAQRGNRWRVGFDGADWWSGREGCYPIGDEHVVEEKRCRIHLAQDRDH
jgi:hypothetical protein